PTLTATELDSLMHQLQHTSKVDERMGLPGWIPQFLYRRVVTTPIPVKAPVADIDLDLACNHLLKKGY
ncbi:MAG: hypothetical protein WB679_20725, partial [Terracidiphilus sp.]